jgi:quercetin dioxygenase-like cupin family protein
MTEIDVKDLSVTHHFGGGVYVKETRIPAGHVLVQHRHLVDHLSLLAAGRALLTRAGASVEVAGPQVLTIVAGELHRVAAITDCLWFCIHATEETDEKAVDQVLIEPILPSTADEMRDLAKGGSQ